MTTEKMADGKTSTKEQRFEQDIYLLIDEWMNRGVEFVKIREILQNNIASSLFSKPHLENAIRHHKAEVKE